MVTNELLYPKSIVVVGASNDIRKPGGKILKNIVDGGFKGSIYVTNPKETEIQGIKCYQELSELPQSELAIMAIAAKYIPDTVKYLTEYKGTKAFIVISAGFSEESEEGKEYEEAIVNTINDAGGSLIGPNCVGVLTPEYHGVFTEPIPKLDWDGCDFISGSGATACFIMEAGIPKGLKFSRVFSVGNSAQMGVEEILKYMDETYDPDKSPKVKLLYIENIDKPEMLLTHAASLIRKGCKIAAIKAGASEAGSRAASSHTGALASSDVAVDALFKKAGIVRCHGREELIQVASIFQHQELNGKNLAIITHAGGPAVMLTDALSKGGLNVPHISSPAAKDLLEELYPGSSVANPIDFLATGTADQLGTIIDYCDQKFDEIDGMIVIFGTPGLFPIHDVYELLHEKMNRCSKPIFPVLPSIVTADAEVKKFLALERINFPDEVIFGQALAKTYFTEPPADEQFSWPAMDQEKIWNTIDNATDGYLLPKDVQKLLDAAGIPRAKEMTASSHEELETAIEEVGFPLVMKVVGPVHKSDVGGVTLNIDSKEFGIAEFERMIKIEDATAVLLQPMLSGTELFAGIKYEENFGHLILCGMGGIFIEILKDVSSGLAPINQDEALKMIRNLKSYKIIEGVRGQKGIDENQFADIVSRLSILAEIAPEIIEMDLNPLLGADKGVIAVDARIKISKG